jgi:hypothetical protein
MSPTRDRVSWIHIEVKKVFLVAVTYHIYVQVFTANIECVS